MREIDKKFIELVKANVYEARRYHANESTKSEREDYDQRLAQIIDLLGQGADAEFAPDKHLPMRLAVASGAYELIEPLQNHGASVYGAGNIKGRSPFKTAAMYGDYKTVNEALNFADLAGELNFLELSQRRGLIGVDQDGLDKIILEIFKYEDILTKKVVIK